MQLETSASRLDGVPKELEDSVRYETSRLLQAAGVLMRLPQEIIAQAMTILCRFWLGPDGGSMLEHDSLVRDSSKAALFCQYSLLLWPMSLKESKTEMIQDVAAASLYLTAKPSAHPVTPRQILTIFAYLSSLAPTQLASESKENKIDVSWQFTEGTYEKARERLYQIELHILHVLGYQTHVALPYTICVNYLQTLEIFNESSNGTVVAKRAFALLNTALLSPQLIYLTHQPPSIAASAIYLAAREENVKLPETEWWEVFDVDREELGFLVVALLSVPGFALKEKRKWEGRRVPRTVKEIQAEINQLQVGEDNS